MLKQKKIHTIQWQNDMLIATNKGSRSVKRGKTNKVEITKAYEKDLIEFCDMKFVDKEDGTAKGIKYSNFVFVDEGELEDFSVPEETGGNSSDNA